MVDRELNTTEHSRFKSQQKTRPKRIAIGTQLLGGGEESQCGWCVKWEFTPAILMKAFTGTDRVVAKCAFDSMMQLKKIDIAAIEAAIRG